MALDINREIMSDEREQEYPVLDEILKLPQKYREVLYLYYYEEYSVKKIGIMLKRKESTIQSRLAAGRNKLKTRLADERVYGNE
ncbi:MAG: sigma factor-like helix-turn-helix DNA-binding protein [Clostridium sp.]